MRRVGLLATLLVLSSVCAAQTIRIGVFGLFKPTQLCVAPAAAEALVVSTDQNEFVIEAGSRPCAVRVVLQAGRVFVRHGDLSDMATRLRVSGRNHGAARFSLSVPGKISRTFEGTIEVSSKQNKLLPIVRMSLETAVASVVAAETWAGTHPEALKAQAVAARSFLVAAKTAHREFDFCDTTHCQFMREPPAPSHPASIATVATRGIVLQHGRQVVAAMYSRACGGQTRSLREIGIDPHEGYPYFSVDCAYCRRNSQQWHATLPAGQRVATERDRLAVGSQYGWSKLPSNSFEVQELGDVILLKGHGEGHSVGLCQQGAAWLAAQGLTYERILAHYYPNTTLGGVSRDGE